MKKQETDATTKGKERPPIPEENGVRMVGRLLKSPKVSTTAGGHKLAVFTLAVPRTFTNGEGRSVKETAYVPVVAWRAVAEQIAPLGKDSALLIEGRLRTWAAEEGKGFRWQVETVLVEVLERHEPLKDPGQSAPKKEGAAA